MPPKAAGKADAGKKKAAEDKTFGMKNKNKSKAVQQYIKQIAPEQQSKEDARRRKEKEDRENERIAQAERDAVFKPVISQTKAPVGADPKSVVCAFFKEGKCTKGGKCKFSHDLSLERKAARINVYADRREDIYKDQASLEAAIKDREGGNGKRCATEIICKHFVDAVERRQYGWIWTCPNGGDKCQYRHALPPGFKLKSELEAEKLLAADDGPSIEDEIEAQRAALRVRTPLTYEVFLAWRERKKREAAEKDEQALRDAKEARAKGKAVTLSGKALFTFDPSLFAGDDAGGGGGGDDELLLAYRKKRAQDGSDDEDDGDEAYGRAAARPLYDAAAQNEPHEEAEDEGGGEGGGSEAEEWFCDGCEGDILTAFRYDCPECEDEFCYCEACHADPAKPHAHAMVRVPRHRPHASSERGRAGAGAPDAAVDESLFDDDEAE